MNTACTWEESILAQTQSEIAHQLATRGYATTEDSDLAVTYVQWRAIARRCARDLSRPLKMITLGSCHFAVLLDWPQAGEQGNYPLEAFDIHNGAEFFHRLNLLRRSTGRPTGRPRKRPASSLN